ncbi:MAG: GGDEF domain-containing protein [Ferrimicrobium sp.]
MRLGGYEATWVRMDTLYWRLCALFILPIVLVVILGGWALRLSDGIFVVCFLIAFLLRSRYRPFPVLASVSVGYLSALFQLSVAPGAVLPGVSPQFWSPALAVFGAIGLFALGLYGGPLWPLLGVVVALAVFSSHLVASIPLIASLILGAGSGIAIRTVVLELAESQALLGQLALTDPMTTLGNRRALELEFSRYQSIIVRESASLVISLWDLDGLKAINDRDGHAVGDRRIQDFAAVLRSELREGDALFRIGGDEFCCLHLGLRDGASVLDRVHRHFPDVSAGFLEVSGRSLEESLKLADRVMYQHKRRGRCDSGEETSESTRPACQE